MAIAYAFFPIRRTMGKLTFYMMDGKNFVRKKSSLSGKKVKKSPQFARTRYYAGLMATASGIGSQIYQALPPRWRQSWMYRAFTGEAMQLLKDGKTKEEAVGILNKLYVAPLPKAMEKQPVKNDKEKRVYIKKDNAYWHLKSEKAARRKTQKEKILYHAGLMARASVIASTVYQNLPQVERKYYHFKILTGFAMRLLKEGFTDVEVIVRTKVVQFEQKTIRKKPLFAIPYIRKVYARRHKQRLRKAKAAIFSIFFNGCCSLTGHSNLS